MTDSPPSGRGVCNPFGLHHRTADAVKLDRLFGKGLEPRHQRRAQPVARGFPPATRNSRSVMAPPQSAMPCSAQAARHRAGIEQQDMARL